MFIAFEGLDGSGSTTQSKLLAERLKKEGHQAFVTKEPTENSPIGKMIREILQHKWETSPEGLQLLFSADRAEHLKNKILPALNEKKTVVTDRYTLSTLAYGGLAIDIKWLAQLNRHFIQPDLTFLFKLDPEICLERIKKRGSKLELFEQKEKLVKIWKNYKKASAYFENIHVIEATRSIEAIGEEIYEMVQKNLK